MTVYRNYDQAQLDAQYNLRARFTDYPKYFNEWQVRGDAERARPGWRLDLAYGPTPTQKLDLAVPRSRTGGRTPLFVFFHGGYWQSLNKRDGAFLAPAFVDAGIAFATVNYTLAPVAGMDQIIRESREALAWLWRQAPAFGCDSSRIFVSGHSAGGHIAMMLAATAWEAIGGLPPDLVKGAFSVSGLYDLEPIRLSYQNPVLKLDPGTVARNSPLHLTPRTRQIVLTVGTKEPDEFQRQQAEFAPAWKAHGANVEIIPAKDLHHFDILAELGNPDHPIGRAARRLVSGR